MRGNRRSDLLHAPFDLSELIDTSDLVVHDDPLPLAQKQSPIQAAARKLLADLAHLTTIRNAQGEPVQAIPDAVDLEPWRKVFTQEIQGIAILNWLVDQNDQASSFSGDLIPDTGSQDSNANEIEGVEVLLEFLNNQSLGNALPGFGISLGSFAGNDYLSSGSSLTDGSSVLVNQIVSRSGYGSINSYSLQSDDLPVFVNPLSSLSDSFSLLPWVEQLFDLVENQPVLSLRGQGQSLSNDVDFASLKESGSELIAQTQQELSSSSEVAFKFHDVMDMHIVYPSDHSGKPDFGPQDIFARYKASNGDSNIGSFQIDSTYYYKFDKLYSYAGPFYEVWSKDDVDGTTFASLLWPTLTENSISEKSIESNYAPMDGWSSPYRQWNLDGGEDYYMTRLVIGDKASVDFSSVGYELAYFSVYDGIGSSSPSYGASAAYSYSDVSSNAYVSDSNSYSGLPSLYQAGLPFSVTQRNGGGEIGLWSNIDGRWNLVSFDGVKSFSLAPCSSPETQYDIYLY